MCVCATVAAFGISFKGIFLHFSIARLMSNLAQLIITTKIKDTMNEFKTNIILVYRKKILFLYSIWFSFFSFFCGLFS